MLYTIPVGGDPSDIAVLARGDYAYVANELTDYVTVVNFRTRSVETRLHLGTEPIMLAATPDGEYVYVTVGSEGRVAVIRTSDNTVVTRIPVGSSPHRLNVTRDGSRVYVANQNSHSVSVIRTSDNTVIATVPVANTPRDVDCLPNGEYAFAAHIYQPELSVIRTSDHTYVGSVPLDFCAHRVYALPGSEYVYANEYHGGRVAVVRVSDLTVVATFHAGTSLCGMCSVNDGDHLFIADGPGGAVAVVRTSDNAVVARIPTSGSVSVKAPADGSFVATADRSARTVTVIGRRAAHDVGPTAILAPAGVVDSGTVITPRVAVRNYGTHEETFPTTLLIGHAYEETVVRTLAAGASDTVAFPDWVAGPAGTLPVMCFTGLDRDQNRANDTIAAVVRVSPAEVTDVGVLAILAPVGTVDSGSVHVPTAVIRNFGSGPAAFPVTFTISPDYARTVEETLAAGRTDTVRFPPWTAVAPGRHGLVCYTALAGDQNPANDTVRDSVLVATRPLRDVATTRILSPPAEVRTGDTLRPVATVTNLGTVTEMYFDVVFRIGEAYHSRRTVTAPLHPDSSVDLVFEPWTATPGVHPVSCSTMLPGDDNPANDKLETEVRVSGPTVLTVEPDQQDRLRAGDIKTYRFHAELTADSGALVSLVLPDARANPGWSASFHDSAGAEPITGLGFLEPGSRRFFTLRAGAPARHQPGADSARFPVTAFLERDPAVRDSALLSLALLAGLEVHNVPNPFESRTVFHITLPEEGTVSLTIFNRAGECARRLLSRVRLGPGTTLEPWDATNDRGQPVAPGTYQYLLEYTRDGKTDRILKKLVVGRE